MALYDLSAKAASKPLYQFLGGSRHAIETDITIGLDTPQKMAEQALAFRQQGATIIKVKLGKKPGDDLTIITGIRKAVGEDIILRIDANQGWSFNEASFLLQEMNDLSIEFCEQPMRTWHDELLPELCKISPVKIMADESCYDHHDARSLIKSNACDYINIKFAKSGGIHEALRIHEAAAEAGMSCMIGGMLESRIGVTAKLHFSYACPFIKFFDLDSPLLGHLEDPVVNGVRYDGFFPVIEDLPGIGADVDEAFLKNCDKWTV